MSSALRLAQRRPPRPESSAAGLAAGGVLPGQWCLIGGLGDLTGFQGLLQGGDLLLQRLHPGTGALQHVHQDVEILPRYQLETVEGAAYDLLYPLLQLFRRLGRPLQALAELLPLREYFIALEVEAKNLQMLASSVEGMLLLGLILWRAPRIVANVRLIRRSPYLMFCTVYTALFIWAWSAILNLGILARQRALVIPFVLALVAALGWDHENHPEITEPGTGVSMTRSVA